MANTKKAAATTAHEGPTYVTLIPGIKDAAEHVVKGEKPREYRKGDDVSHWDADRLQSAIKRGLVAEGTPNAPEATDAESDTETDTDSE